MKWFAAFVVAVFITTVCCMQSARAGDASSRTDGTVDQTRPRAGPDIPAVDRPRTDLSPPRAPAQARCCKICRKGKACGNSCISRLEKCWKPPGCACDARR